MASSTTRHRFNSRADGATRARYAMLALIAGGTMINYLDRTILGIAAPALSDDLAINATMMGVVFSIFSWSYVAFQIPGGLLLDRMGSRITYGLALAFWSFFTLIQALATGVWGLLAMRLGLGVAESPCFPTNGRVVAAWFPVQERAMATGVYTVGEYVGLALFSPLLFWMLATFGWESLFWSVGGVGMLFAAIWYWRYRDPDVHQTVNQAELDHIAEGGGLTQASHARSGFDWRDIPRLLKYRQLTGICLGQFAGNSTLVFFLTWFPTYLVEQRGMAWINAGFYSVMPFIAAGVGVLFGGWLSDTLLRRGFSINLARKGPITFGLLMASVIIAANYVQSNALVIAILSVAFFSQGMAALGWSLVSDIAPSEKVGLTGGIFNLAANLAGIITPIVVGVIVQDYGSFNGALIYVGGVALLGAFSYIFIVGDIKRIDLTTDR